MCLCVFLECKTQINARLSLVEILCSNDSVIVFISQVIDEHYEIDSEEKEALSSCHTKRHLQPTRLFSIKDVHLKMPSV